MSNRKEIVELARRDLENSLGSAFAEKASDDLCLIMASSEAAPRRDVRRGDSTSGDVVRESSFGEPLSGAPIIVELDADEMITSTHERWKGLESTAAGRLAGAWPEGADDSDRQSVDFHLKKALRASAIDDLRRRFADMSRSIRGRLEESARRVAAPEGVETEGMAFTQTCWLNGTTSTAGFTPGLAEVADSPEILGFDTPRRLYREVDLTQGIVGAPDFRDAHGGTGRGVVVAVIDSEIDLTHPALQPVASRRWNFTSEAWGNAGKHGTAVAGIVHQIAPEATIFNYKIFAKHWWMDANDFGGSMAIQQALEDGAVVANCSWGAGPAKDGTSREAKACDTAWAFGLTVVKSAGNKGPGAGTLTSPADADGVVVVGATDRDGLSIGPYSSRGPTGHGLQRPHLVAPGGLAGAQLGIRSTLLGDKFGQAGNGTSYAAPHVSGAVALILEQRPNLDPGEIRDLLIAACSPVGDDPDDDAQGAGLLDLRAINLPV